MHLQQMALRPVICHFLCCFKKSTNRDNKKIQLKLARKRRRSRKTIFGPSKYFQLHFR